MKLILILTLIAVLLLVAVVPVIASTTPGPGYGQHISQMAKICDKAMFGQCVANMSRGGGCPCSSCPGSCSR